MLIERPYTSNKTEWIFKVLKFSFHRSMEQNTDPETDTHKLAQLTFLNSCFFFLLLLKN